MTILNKNKIKFVVDLLFASVLVFTLYINPALAAIPTKPVPPTTTNPPTTTTTPPTTTTSTPVTAGPAEKSIGDYLCTPTDTNLYDCINKVYRFSIVVGFVIAVMFIVFAGYLYMTGGEKGITQAKSIGSSTGIALVIMLTSFILLKQINPNLVVFKKIQPPKINDESIGGPIAFDLPELDGDTVGGGSVSGGGGGAGNKHPELSCGTSQNNCVDLKTLGVACASDCLVQKNLGTLLQKLDGLTPFTVSHGYDPGNHSNGSCHNYGSCADMVPNPRNAEGYAVLCTAIATLKSEGLSFQSEDPNNPNSFLANVAECKPYIGGKVGKGDHIHAYLTN